MTALREWQKQVEEFRRQRKTSENDVWKRISHQYEQRVQGSNYVDLVLPRLLKYLSPSSRVLEIGPGTGAFTIPLAEKVEEIVAVEPASSMRTILAEKLTEKGLENVLLVPKRIEESFPNIKGPFDLALASYSLYNVKLLDKVIEKVLKASPHFAVLMGAGENPEWRKRLERQFLGKERVRPPQISYFFPVLLELGIYADLEILWTSLNYIYADEDSLVENWMNLLEIEAKRRPELRKCLLELIDRKNDSIGIYSRRRMALIWIDRERSLF